VGFLYFPSPCGRPPSVCVSSRQSYRHLTFASRMPAVLTWRLASQRQNASVTSAVSPSLIIIYRVLLCDSIRRKSGPERSRSWSPRYTWLILPDASLRLRASCVSASPRPVGARLLARKQLSRPSRLLARTRPRRKHLLARNLPPRTGPAACAVPASSSAPTRL
jgi:hypothetical protein